MKKLIYIFAGIALLPLLTSRMYSQVAAMPYTSALDSFYVVTGTTVDAPGVDDVNYYNKPIGFNFYYHGNSYHNMTISTNGYISLDSVAPMILYSPLSGSTNNVISPLGADLIHTLATGSLQYLTIGTAPNRECIIQWLHYSYYPGGSGDVSFQVHLYETSNCIRFVYGSNTMTSPHTTQIGIRGASNMDYIALGDTTCNWANAYPYPAIATLFPVSSSCSMPAGFAFHFGACTGGAVSFGYITGKVFNDLNANGTLDAGEPGIPYHIIHVMPGSYYVSSDATGSYSVFFTDSTLTYTLNTGGITYWNQTNVPASPTCNPATQTCSGYNFGFHQIPNVHEVSITCPNWGARPSTPEPMPISYQNNGTTTESDTISFVMDALYSFISATPAPVSVVGQTIKWYYSGLLPAHTGCINLYLLPSASAVLGNYLNSTLTIKPLSDTIPTNNVVALHQLITNSWDPNAKLAEPGGMIASGTTIDYTVHFQNTGSAPAINVTVTDVLDASLDPLSFNLLGSSHPVNFAMSGSGIATFTFYSINLPDSSANFAASNGYVSFSIKTKAALPPSTVINNVAGIVFDYNSPVLTNTAADTIEAGIALGIKNYPENAGWNVYPNPSSENIRFVSINSKEKATVRIATIEGRVVLERHAVASGENIDISQLAEGVYMCTIQSTERIEMVKLVKQK